MIRIGILAQGFIDWAGGIDFLYSVVDSIRACGDAVELHVLLPEPRPRATTARWLQAVRHAWFPRQRMTSGVQPPSGCVDVSSLCDATHRIARGRRGLDAATARLGLDVLLPSHAPLPEGLGCPWIGYVYDFQHRRLPALFTDRERRQRDRRFASMLSLADAVIVNSLDTAAEAREAYPEYAPKVRALPFNASPRAEWLDHPHDVPTSPVAEVAGGPRYFMVSNQFWVHKDHPTAFRAFARLASLDRSVNLVCTGETSDYRRPDYFPSLQRLVADLGIADRVTITGLLPKLDQIALLRKCVALVQPTLCEGGPGGGAVYDAVAIGIRAIVSDIPINRELSAEQSVTFFPAGDDAALSMRMKETLDRPATTPTIPELIAAGRNRRAACGRVIMDLVAEIRAARL